MVQWLVTERSCNEQWKAIKTRTTNHIKVKICKQPKHSWSNYILGKWNNLHCQGRWHKSLRCLQSSHLLALVFPRTTKETKPNRSFRKSASKFQFSISFHSVTFDFDQIAWNRSSSLFLRNVIIFLIFFREKKSLVTWILRLFPFPSSNEPLLFSAML